MTKALLLSVPNEQKAPSKVSLAMANLAASGLGSGRQPIDWPVNRDGLAAG